MATIIIVMIRQSQRMHWRGSVEPAEFVYAAKSGWFLSPMHLKGRAAPDPSRLAHAVASLCSLDVGQRVIEFCGRL
jgi:hypothetical protein